MNRRNWLLRTAALLVAPCRAAGAGSREAWQSLFDGATLGRWEQTSFGGEGPVRVRDGAIVLEFGDPLTGITWTGDLPRTNYEIALEAARLAGSDFFCGLTFPVGPGACSLIVGGWGGTTVGLSTIDGMDASQNETTLDLRFEDDRWYAVRLRVAPDRIAAWIDEEPVVDVAIEGRRIGIRPEVDPSRPLGVAAYRTRAALRAIRLRALTPEGLR